MLPPVRDSLIVIVSPSFLRKSVSYLLYTDVNFHGEYIFFQFSCGINTRKNDNPLVWGVART